jgi:hypothetical protein
MGVRFESRVMCSLLTNMATTSFSSTCTALSYHFAGC